MGCRAEEYEGGGCGGRGDTGEGTGGFVMGMGDGGFLRVGMAGSYVCWCIPSHPTSSIDRLDLGAPETIRS